MNKLEFGRRRGWETHKFPRAGNTRFFGKTHTLRERLHACFLALVHVPSFAEENPRLVTALAEIAFLNGGLEK